PARSLRHPPWLVRDGLPSSSVTLALHIHIVRQNRIDVETPIEAWLAEDDREGRTNPNQPPCHCTLARQDARATQAARAKVALRASVSRVPPLSSWLRFAGSFRCGWL